MDKRRVILVTDGDEVARHAVETAVAQVGARCISLSAGNPTQLTGSEIAEQVMKAAHDPVVVMFDDNGNRKQGFGERALKLLAAYPQFRVIGAIAVASGAHSKRGINVNFSINRYGKKVDTGVDKQGYDTSETRVFGDTVEVLNEIDVPLIVGMGDPGKMDGLDDPGKGSPITTKALREIIENYKTQEN